MNDVARHRGVGIEIAAGTLRGARVIGSRSFEIVAAAEFSFALHDVDSVVLERFVRLRAELGDPDDPVRLAWFPPGSVLQRLDVTGRSGPELNDHRRRLELDHDITSTMLVDDGPRRWLYTIRWDSPDARRLEDLAERAGFVDVAIEPAPISLTRVLPADITFARRLAAQEDAFEAAIDRNVVVAAASTDVRGRIPPALDTASPSYPVERFDGLLDDPLLAAELAALDAPRPHRGASGLVVSGRPHPPYPDSDVRAAARIAVALGAAVAASGAAGLQRPVDMVMGEAPTGDARPWAIERVSDLSDSQSDGQPGTLRRLSARLAPRPRRHRRR
jgi:hypothetical protein